MVANQAQVFGQIIDFYTGAGKAHLPEINRLAKLNTDAADDILLHYVMEAIRLNGTFGAFRRCNQETTILDGDTKRTFKSGDLIFVGFVALSRDPKIYPDPERVRLDRPIDSYVVYGIGPHNCLGGEASRVALTAMLKVVGRLDNFRAAPGAQGKMKKVMREGGFYVYMDALESGYFPFPTTMKVMWDGGWNEPAKSGDGGKF
jgi:linoleate 10R-lipoxygenase